MKHLLFASLLALVPVVACSSGSSEPSNDGCPGVAPQITCKDCCDSGEHTETAVCVDHAWSCGVCTAACKLPDDGGTDAGCAGPAPQLECHDCCGTGMHTQAGVCIAGQWSCGVCTAACVADAGHD